MIADAKTPNKINGIASRIILKNIVLTLNNELGIVVKNEKLFTTSENRNSNEK